MRRTLAAMGAAMLLLVSGCGVEPGVEGSGRPGRTEASSSPLAADEIFERTRGSVAFVETSLGTGSAVLLDDGHLVTNAHVVDPFDRVDLTFEGGESHDEVPVVAVDLDADLALLGPISTEASAVDLADPSDLTVGSPVYLVGFPGDQRELEATMSSGVLSRRRRAEGWNLEFLQTDTMIAGGQSGGALVDARGRTIAISGMRDGDGFALSLSGGDVIDRLDDLRSGGGTAWNPVALGELTSSWSFRGPNAFFPHAFYLPASPQTRELILEVDGPDPMVAVGDVGYALSPWTADERAIEAAADGEAVWVLDEPEVLESDGRGTWTVTIDADFDAMVMVATGDVGAELTLRSSEPMVERRGQFSFSEELEVGDRRTFTLDYLDDWAAFDLILDEGEQIEISASSATGDVAWEVVPEPETGLDDDAIEEARGFADDGGGGLFDLDALDSYTAEVEGLHTLFVYAYDPASVQVRLSVDPG